MKKKNRKKRNTTGTASKERWIWVDGTIFSSLLPFFFRCPQLFLLFLFRRALFHLTVLLVDAMKCILRRWVRCTRTQNPSLSHVMSNSCWCRWCVCIIGKVKKSRVDEMTKIHARWVSSRLRPANRNNNIDDETTGKKKTTRISKFVFIKIIMTKKKTYYFVHVNAFFDSFLLNHFNWFLSLLFRFIEARSISCSAFQGTIGDVLFWVII